MAESVLLGPSGKVLLDSTDNSPMLFDWDDWPSTVSIAGSTYYYYPGQAVLGTRTLSKESETVYSVAWSQNITDGFMTTPWYFKCDLRLCCDETAATILWRVRHLRSQWFPTYGTVVGSHTFTVTGLTLSPFGTYTYKSGGDSTSSIVVSA